MICSVKAILGFAALVAGSAWVAPARGAPTFEGIPGGGAAEAAGGRVPAEAEAGVAGGPATVIQSEELEMQSSAERNFFYFRGDVRVSGNNLTMTCERMEVISSRETADADATIGRIGAIEKIIALGDVVIVQEGRRATAGRAEIFPREGLIYLKDDPVFTDAEATVRGYEMVLDKERRSAKVIPYPQEQGGRTTVELPALPDIAPEREKPEGFGEEGGGGGR